MNENQKLMSDFANSTGVFAPGNQSLSAKAKAQFDEFVAEARRLNELAIAEPDTRARARLILSVDKNLAYADGIRAQNGLSPITTPDRELTEAELEKQDDAAVSEMLRLAGDPAAAAGEGGAL